MSYWDTDLLPLFSLCVMCVWWCAIWLLAIIAVLWSESSGRGGEQGMLHRHVFEVNSKGQNTTQKQIIESFLQKQTE